MNVEEGVRDPIFIGLSTFMPVSRLCGGGSLGLLAFAQSNCEVCTCGDGVGPELSRRQLLQIAGDDPVRDGVVGCELSSRIGALDSALVPMAG